VTLADGYHAYCLWCQTTFEVRAVGQARETA
jgi:hypothetical protein